jgi:hypothetical protein
MSKTDYKMAFEAIERDAKGDGKFPETMTRFPLTVIDTAKASYIGTMTALKQTGLAK